MAGIHPDTIDGRKSGVAKPHEMVQERGRLVGRVGKSKVIPALVDKPFEQHGHPYRLGLLLRGRIPAVGGQVVLPLVGAIAAQKFPVVAGIGRRDRTTMFVSRGVGTIYVPVRINCPPEVAVLTLQPA